jgi:hypothetical protein
MNGPTKYDQTESLGHTPLPRHRRPEAQLFGYIDLEEKTLQPLDNPFGPKVLPM